MIVSQQPLPTAYQVLGVHPSAPTELISSCYWSLTKELQDRRKFDRRADLALHRATVAYQVLSDPERRHRYNQEIGFDDPPLVTRPLPRRRSALGRLLPGSKSRLRWSVEPLEVMCLDEQAPSILFQDAYLVMRERYLRLQPGSKRRRLLLRMLDESYELLSSAPIQASNGLDEPRETDRKARTSGTDSAALEPVDDHQEPHTKVGRSWRPPLTSATRGAGRAAVATGHTAIAGAKRVGGAVRAIIRASKRDRGSRQAGAVNGTKSALSTDRHGTNERLPRRPSKDSRASEAIDLYLGRIASAIEEVAEDQNANNGLSE